MPIPDPAPHEVSVPRHDIELRAARRQSSAIRPPVGAAVQVAPQAHHRLLAYGVLAVMVVEDMDASGYTPERFAVTVGGQPADIYSAEFDQRSGERRIDTSVGLVVIPGAQQRAAGAMVTVNGTPIPGA